MPGHDGPMFTLALSSGAELRPLQSWHAVEFAAHMDRAREHIRPWVGPGFVNDPAGEVLQRYVDAGRAILGVWADGILVGGVMIVAIGGGVAEIGCWTEPAGEGGGHITAASRVLIEHLFTERGVHRVEWRCRADNARSSAVAERLGMTLEGVLRESWPVGGVFHDKQVWSVLDREWTALSA